MTARKNEPVWALHGEAVTPDLTGALFLPVHRTLIVADLHFEKGSSYAERGQMLPPYDTRATLLKLSAAIARHRPETVVALGDSFHDLRADGRMDDSDADMLARLVRDVSRWVWIEGNHDPEPPARFGGEVRPVLELGTLTLRHEPTEGNAPGEIAGHLHPCARVSGNGRSVRARCFATDGRRMVLPSFGAFTGGLSVRDAAFTRVFGSCPDGWIIGRTSIYAVQSKRIAN
ncbi:ligase-associated DNA damage response endonuclease PdeM [Hyphobacterium marinum]|uniref:Ligase-associated DNA damage response endonuclease PdeM n=1 Tax=Hyphobacterium marinum TaxID=3116574 RepID=A0ABU7LY23_9PROT|nr:ligase-associated DNA damage response endonuclease PdeM [Hyphobacterium sp. Y6023]MEE2565905.1 ligase-associated DNA damage response endonuclease PdeM [Hyphobacterium sp. Y6023]